MVVMASRNDKSGSKGSKPIRSNDDQDGLSTLSTTLTSVLSFVDGVNPLSSASILSLLEEESSDVSSLRSGTDTGSEWTAPISQSSLRDNPTTISSTLASGPHSHDDDCFCGQGGCHRPPDTYEQFRSAGLYFTNANLSKYLSPECKKWFEILKDGGHPGQSLVTVEVPRVLEAYNNCIKSNGRVEEALFDLMRIWGGWHFLYGRGNQVVFRIGSHIGECWKKVEVMKKPWSDGTESKPDRFAKTKLTALSKALDVLNSQLRQKEKTIRNPEKLADLLKLQLMIEGNEARGDIARA